LQSPFHEEVKARYNRVKIAEKFGYTPEEIDNLPLEFYEDALTILNMTMAKENAKNSLKK
jgi:hypothetical protein